IDVVRDRGDHSHIVVQTDRGKGFSPDRDRMHKLDRDVLRVGGGAAISADEYLLMRMKRSSKLQRSGKYFLLVFSEESSFNVDALSRFFKQGKAELLHQFCRFVLALVKERVKRL